MLKRKKAPRKEKSAALRYTVVRQDDAREPKYLHKEASDGFDLAHAQELAYHVKGQRARYSVVPLHVHRAARAAGEPMTAEQAIARFPETPEDQDDA